MDATCTIQDSIHVFNLVHKYVSRILGTYQTSIGTGVLENAPNVTATVVKGTYGEEWCKNNNIKYIYG